MLTTVNYHIHGRLWRHSRDSQALSGPMWNKVSWDTGRVSTYICTKYASQVPEEDAHGNYTHHQSQSQLCCPLNRISACRTGAGFLQFSEWRISSLSFWGNKSIHSLKPSMPRKHRDLATISACGASDTQEGLSQQQWLMFYPVKLWRLLCSAFIDLSVMESPWILWLYDLLSSSTACCIAYSTWIEFILLLWVIAQS